MTGLELLDFVSKYSPDVTSFSNVAAAEAYFNETVAKGLFIAKYYKGKLVAVLCYYRVPTVESAVIFDGRVDLPETPDRGLYAYVSFVCIHPDYRSMGIMQYFANKVSNLKPPIKAGIWVDPKGSWKIQNRSIDMKSNCGILAFDQISGMLNGRSNVISISTLARIAQDNDFLLYPMKLKRANLVELKTPFIIHADFHFQTINSQDDLIPFAVPEEVYVLAQDIDVGEVVDEDEAKKVRGAKKFFKDIVAPFYDPLNLSGIRGTPFTNISGSANTILPILGGLAGSFIPGLGTGVGAALGAGLSRLGSGLLTGQNVGQAALSGAIAGGGTYLGSQLLGHFGSAGGSATGGGGGGGASDALASGAADAGTSGSAFGSSVGNASGIAGSGLGSAADYGLGAGGSAGLTSLGSTIGSGADIASGVGSGLGGAAASSATPGASSSLLTNSAGQGSKSLLDKIGPGGALGALSLGTGLLKSATEKNPLDPIPAELQQATDAAQQGVSLGGSTPQGLAASGELTRGINAGVGGIFPQANDQYLQASLAELDRQAAIQRQNFITTQAKFGRTNSGETIQQLQEMDQTLAKQKSDATLQFQEAQRQQAISGMQQYLSLASQGDQASLKALVDALGNEAAAKQAIQAYTAGKQSAQNNTLGNLGTTLLANQFAPQANNNGITLKVGG